jgi:hypothetical protein
VFDRTDVIALADGFADLDVDAARLHGLGQLTLQLDLEQAVL